MPEYLLFDLDGTLTDPGEGITNSVKYALEKFNIHIEDRRELYRFIGPPLIDSFCEFYGMTADEANLALKYYREYFVPHGMFENKVYDGIPEMLYKLNEKGFRLVLATSKPEPFAEKILEHFDLKKYFYFICGSTLDEKRTKKGEVIEFILNALNITDKTSAVMIGDREHDIFGAKENGLKSIGVLYGYGSYEELENAGADYIASSVNELTKIFTL